MRGRRIFLPEKKGTFLLKLPADFRMIGIACCRLQLIACECLLILTLLCSIQRAVADSTVPFVHRPGGRRPN